MSTILGHVVRADGAGATGNVVLRPVRTPVLADTDLVVGADVELQPDANGDFSVTLVTGQYAVLIPGARFPVVIGVPDDAETYELASLITSPLPVVENVAPAITVAMWSDYELEKMVRGGAFTLDDESISGLNASCAVTWPAPDGETYTGTFTITGWSEEHDRETAFTVTHEEAGKVISVAARTLNDDGQFTTPMAITITDIPPN